MLNENFVDEDWKERKKLRKDLLFTADSFFLVFTFCSEKEEWSWNNQRPDRKRRKEGGLGMESSSVDG
jgi:hypothetical protein